MYDDIRYSRKYREKKGSRTTLICIVSARVWTETSTSTTLLKEAIVLSDFHVFFFSMLFVFLFFLNCLFFHSSLPFSCVFLSVLVFRSEIGAREPSHPLRHLVATPFLCNSLSIDAHCQTSRITSLPWSRPETTFQYSLAFCDSRYSQHSDVQIFHDVFKIFGNATSHMTARAWRSMCRFSCGRSGSVIPGRFLQIVDDTDFLDARLFWKCSPGLQNNISQFTGICETKMFLKR